MRNILLFILIMSALGCPKHEDPIAEYKDGIDQISQNKRQISSLETIALPKEYLHLTIDGKVYCTNRSNHQNYWLFFQDWRGKGTNLSGYLFTDGEELLIDSLIDINALIPRWKKARLTNVIVQKRISDNWYFVIWNLD
ncbi:MAG: hypothetical protein GY793_00050 [Proteobacteria bacterium]|nr:hypothetical protein [Pseudomonadota bacterium]